MSRKREKRRGKEAEMARQLGVKSLDDKARELVAKGRVGHVELRPLSVSVANGPRGLLSRFRRHQVQCALGAYLVDGHGVHLVSHQVFEIDPSGESPLSLEHLPHPKVDVRYERPAHFIVLLEVFNHDDTTAFGDAPDAVTVASSGFGCVGLDDKALLKKEAAIEVKVSAHGTERVGCLRAVAGVHKWHATESFQLTSTSGHIFDFSIGIRL